MLNPREEKKQKQKTSETAIKSLEELSRVMRCRQSIPSFYPHVKSAPPPPITCASSILSTMKESTETSLYSYIWREKNDEMCIFHAFYHRYIYIAEVNV